MGNSFLPVHTERGGRERKRVGGKEGREREKRRIEERRGEDRERKRGDKEDKRVFVKERNYGLLPFIALDNKGSVDNICGSNRSSFNALPPIL